MIKVVQFLNSDEGVLFTSIVLGLGLATMFRLSCNGAKCVEIRAPDLSTLRRNVYEMDGTCYKYTPAATRCPAREP